MSQWTIVGGQVAGFNPNIPSYYYQSSVSPQPSVAATQQTPQTTTATKNLSSVSLMSSDTVEAANKASTRGYVPTEQDLAGVDPETQKEIQASALNRIHGGGMSVAELEDFETLVSRLEESKMKQAGQANRARQRDLFAGGLASMMGNF